MKFKVIQTLQELKTVQPYWERWQDHANNDFAQYNLVCQLRPEIESPFVIVIEKNNQICALLVGRLERTQFAPSIGYLRPVKVPTKALVIIHQGLLGQLNEEGAKDTVHYLRSLLSSGVADAIEFHHLSEYSTILQAVLAYNSLWFCEKKLSWNTHREMDILIEGKFIDCKVKAKHRTRIRKKQRELESAFPGRVTWRWLSQFDDIPALCVRLEEVAALTYQRGLGAGFVDNEEYRQRFALFSRPGQLRVQLLEIDGKVRAFWFGFIYQGVFHSSETGYDSDLRNYEVGTLIFIRMVDELAQEGGVQKLDFGLGDASYKQRFGDHFWRETTIWLFAPTVKGLILRSMLRIAIIMDSVARQILEKLKLTDRVKTIWRKKVAKGEMETDKS
ncbi:GNAT family N-acetyltransferase [Methyloglobulus sp.]|uniref:GNAT family N-acetyltransferase n=1 Tax=Methyloglobulus sp. TaxID=2518622 RepID=UPI0032B7B473